MPDGWSAAIPIASPAAETAATVLMTNGRMMGFARAQPILHQRTSPNEARIRSRARHDPVGNQQSQRRRHRSDERSPGDIDHHHRPGPVFQQRQRRQFERRITEQSEQGAIQQTRLHRCGRRRADEDQDARDIEQIEQDGRSQTNGSKHVADL